MKYVIIAALTLTSGAAFAAEPDICYAGEVPADAIVSNRMDASPFTGMDRTLMSLYIPRALCGFDVERDISFWRSYYAAFGCSANSEVGQLMESWLIDTPNTMAPDFAAAKEQAPERVAAVCERVVDCVVPDTYDITGETGLYCPSLGE